MYTLAVLLVYASSADGNDSVLQHVQECYRGLVVRPNYVLITYLFILFSFIYLKLLVYTCKTTMCGSQKHRNISYTGVTRQGRMALTGVNAQNNLNNLK